MNSSIRYSGFVESYNCKTVNFRLVSVFRALLVEGLPKDVTSDLQGESDPHWNLILPQLNLYKVVLKVLKLPVECSLD